MYRRKRIYKYFGTWIGPKGYMRLPGVGRIIPGKEVELSKRQAQAFESSPNWKIRKSYEYEK
ncbi:MAG: hypothetical protein ACTSR3_23635 [Candidatus Helarchaeota archaeon]